MLEDRKQTKLRALFLGAAISASWALAEQELPEGALESAPDPAVAAEFNIPPEVAAERQGAEQALSAETVELPDPDPVLTDATTISNLFAAYVEALGGRRHLGRLQTVVYTGSLEVNETTSDFENHQSRDGRFVSVIQLPGNTKRVGYDGETAWSQTGNVKWSAVSPHKAKQEMFFRHLPGFVNWRTNYLHTELLPDTEFNGRPMKVVRAESIAGAIHTIFFDEQNHRVVRVDEKLIAAVDGTGGSEHYLQDYRMVDDVVLPFMEQTVIGERTLTRRLRSVELTDQPAESFFSTPKQARVAKSGVRDTERHFDRLTVGGVVYSNVWVHRQTNFNVLIRHSRGIQTIRLTDLPEEDLAELRPQLGDLANIEDKQNVMTDKWEEFAGNAEFQTLLRDRAQTISEMMALVFIPFLIGWLVAHLIWSYIIKRLCDKTETKGGFAVWIPFVQMAPMFRAAGFSDRWVGSILALTVLPGILFAIAQLMGFQIEPDSVAALVGGALVLVGWLVLLVASIMWPFKICSRCHKSPFLGLLMFVPAVNIGVILYLAFSREE